MPRSRKEILDFLLDEGADTSIRHHGQTALHWAAAIGHLGFVNALLSKGASASVHDDFGKTPLHFAANLGVQRALIAAGADVRAKDDLDFTPMWQAIRNGWVDTARLYFENGASLGDFEDYAFDEIARRLPGPTGVEMANLLIDFGANTSVAWRAAAAFGNASLFRFLLDSGVQLPLDELFGRVSADFAIKNAWYCAERDGFDRLSFHESARQCENERVEIISVLLRAGHRPLPEAIQAVEKLAPPFGQESRTSSIANPCWTWPVWPAFPTT